MNASAVTTTKYTITPEQAALPAYATTLAEELEGGSLSVEDLEKSRINHPLILKYKAKMLSGRGDFREYADWTAFLKEAYPTRRRSLSLGAGLGRVEHYLVKTGFCPKIEAIDLCMSVNEATRIQDSRIAAQAGDLNFVELPENQYDFIICHGILHHLINLEHVLDQINKALTDDGLALIYEFVGETQWQFSESRKSLLGSSFPEVKFDFPPRWTVPAFESVRSGDLLGIISSLFSQTCDRAASYGGIYFPFVVSTTGSQDRHLPEVLALDERVSQNGEVAPCYHMGVYRKSRLPGPAAKPWSDAELERRLDPGAPVTFAARERMKKTWAWRAARSVKRAVLR
jgi:SAM-dependent methyltransferase